MGDGPPPDRPYYADQHYLDEPSYRERRLHRNDAIYRGRDGRYYCKRNDGTTGLIVGALAGGVLGELIAPGGARRLARCLVPAAACLRGGRSARMTHTAVKHGFATWNVATLAVSPGQVGTPRIPD